MEIPTPVLFPGVGISIEFRVTYRHTDCTFAPFSGIHPREIVLLSGRFPHHLSGLVRNDREFGFGMTRSDDAANSNLSLRPVIGINHFIKPGIGCQPGSAS